MSYKLLPNHSTQDIITALTFTDPVRAVIDEAQQLLSVRPEEVAQMIHAANPGVVYSANNQLAPVMALTTFVNGHFSDAIDSCVQTVMAQSRAHLVGVDEGTISEGLKTQIHTTIKQIASRSSAKITNLLIQPSA